MKLYVSARVNSEELENKAVYHLVKDGIGGISVLKGGYRIGYVDGEATGCISAEQLSGHFAISCRAAPVTNLGSHAVFCVMGMPQRLLHILRNMLHKEKRIVNFDPVPFCAVRLKRYPLSDEAALSEDNCFPRRSKATRFSVID